MRLACTCALLTALLQAQSPIPKFDVVSIKRCDDTSAPAAPSSPGRLSTGCARLSDTDNIGMIQRAYVRYAGGVLNSTRVLTIEGVPDWVYSERFEINARSEGHPTTLMMEGPMMQQVLEDRFKLRLHRETRQAPVYELVVGKGSPKLKPFHGANCTPVHAGQPLPTLEAGERYCRRMVSPRGALDMEAGTLREAADLLSMVVDRPVIDKTGLTGQFVIHLVFSPEDPAITNPDAPAIFQALQQQLGLRLVPARGPIEVLVIDHIEKPSEN